MTTPERRALNFYGSKWQLAPWILSYFVAHENYLEPCLGSAAILLRKARAKVETVGDLNSRIVNYFKVLRDNPHALIKAIETTPWAEEEYYLGEDIDEDPLEDARRFHIFCWMSIRGGPEYSGFRMQKTADGRSSPIAHDMMAHDLHTVADRLQGVQILKRDALASIDTFKNSADALVYFDPPYVPEERKMRSAYGAHEVDEQFHRDAAILLRQFAGLALVSGYACDLYAELYEEHGWMRKDKTARTNSGSEREESLWLSPRLHERLGHAADLPLWSWQGE